MSTCTEDQAQQSTHNVVVTEAPEGNDGNPAVFQTTSVSSEVLRVTAVDGDSTPANNRVAYYTVITHPCSNTPTK